MTRLSQERAAEIIESNIRTIYHIPAEYTAIRHYIGASELRRTLLKILQFLKKLYTTPDEDNHIIIDQHRYEFFLFNNKLAYGIRNSSGTATANRHMNLLCALGFFDKIPQREGNRLRVNDNFKAKNPNQREISVYSFRELTPRELQRIEERARRLQVADITVGNIGFVSLYLAWNDLSDIAIEVFPKNAKSAPDKKLREYMVLQQCLDLLIEQQGYATRKQVSDTLTYTDQELKRLYGIFRKHLSTLYDYHRPTKDELTRYQLKNKQFIYTRRENGQ